MNMRLELLLVILVACDAGKKPEPPSPPTSVRPTSDATREMQVQPLDAAVPTGDVVAAPTVDDAVTTASPGDIAVTWVVYPPSVPLKRDPQILQQPVIIEVTASGTTSATKLPPQFGSLEPYNQAACSARLGPNEAGPTAYGLEKGEVAKITFYEGGAGGFFVRRKGDALVIYSWAQTDGLCGTVEKPVECPRNAKEVATVPVKAKAGAKVVEDIVEVDTKGARHPFNCERDLQDY